MAAAVAVQGTSGPRGKWLRWATMLATPIVLAMETRRISPFNMADNLYLVIPVAVAGVLLLHGHRQWIDMEQKGQ